MREALGVPWREVWAGLRPQSPGTLVLGSVVHFPSLALICQQGVAAYGLESLCGLTLVFCVVLIPRPDQRPSPCAPWDQNDPWVFLIERASEKGGRIVSRPSSERKRAWSVWNDLCQVASMCGCPALPQTLTNSIDHHDSRNQMACLEVKVQAA